MEPECIINNEGEGKSKGYFRVDHQIFEDSRMKSLSGECFRVFLWMSSRAWRFPASRGFLRASVSYIHVHTGVSEATINRSLSDLKVKNLIELLSVDYKLGNQWWISPVFKSAQIEKSHFEAPQNNRASPSKGQKYRLIMDNQASPFEVDLININKEKNNDENDEWDIEFIRKCFAEKYPDPIEQQEQLKLLVDARFQGIFKPPQTVMENLVLMSWFNETLGGKNFN